jgi:hypothetical protein
MVSYLTAPDDPQLLRRFYRQVRPWGFWSPIEQQVRTDDPSFRPNCDMNRDMVNCAVGIVWQVALCLIPVYTVIRRFDALAGALVVAGATSLVLKLNWYDKLPPPGDSVQPFDVT